MTDDETRSSGVVVPLGYGDAAPPRPDEHPRCWKCSKHLAEFLTRPWSIRCPRCRSVNNSPG